MTKTDLINFEQEIADTYETGIIKGPIHLRNGNEEQLIEIFKLVNPQDYVFSSWASHLEALLKGVPQDLVKQQILQGNSITLCFPEYNFYTSAIVGGICPIAVETALGIKKKGMTEQKVWCFIGDMAYMTGITQECIEYSENFDLPIVFGVEDNGKSVCTPTEEVWGISCKEKYEQIRNAGKHKNVQYFQYELSWPHAGIDKFIHF